MKGSRKRFIKVWLYDVFRTCAVWKVEVLNFSLKKNIVQEVKEEKFGKIVYVREYAYEQHSIRSLKNK